MKKYIGLDVHCKWTVFVAQDSNGKVIKKGKVRTTPEALVGLVESVGADKGTSVGMESGTQATWAARLLAAAGRLEACGTSALHALLSCRKAPQTGTILSVDEDAAFLLESDTYIQT